MRHSIFFFWAGSFLLAGVVAQPAFASPILYQVTVDTSTLSAPPPAQYGYIDMQFNPAAVAGQQSATATISNFMTNGTLNPFPADPNNGVQGNVSGTLGKNTTVTFHNGASVNEYTEDLLFGSTITFDLLLDGAMIETPNNQGGGTTFYLDFLDVSGDFLLTNDPGGNTATGYFVGFVTINPDGTTSTTETPGPNGVASDVTFTKVNSLPGAVPEPSTYLLLGGGLAGLGAWARRRRSVVRAM